MVSACVKKIPVHQPLGAKFTDSDAEIILTKFKNNRDSIKTFKALYYTILEYEQKKERLRQVFVYEQPDKLRFELLPTTSSYSLGVLIAKDNKAQFVDSQSGQKTESDSVEDLLYDLLRIEAKPQELIEILLGMLPKQYQEDGQVVDMYYGLENGPQLFSKDNTYNAYFNFTDSTLKRVQILDRMGRRVLFEVEYADYKKIKDQNVPHEVTIHIVRDGVVANLKLNHIDINKAIPSKMFDFF